jgi:hypothetical protein
MPINQPADGDTSWGAEVRAAIGAINGARTVYAFDPPPDLSPLVSGAGDQSVNLQAQLDYVKNQFGGGRVVIIKPGATLNFAAGVTIPTRVQLVMDERTILDFSAMGDTGSAITVNDNDFVPLVGVRIQGPSGDPRTTPTNTTDLSIGVNVSGVGNYFHNLRIKSFSRGYYTANSGTYINTMVGGSIVQCRNAVYNDAEVGSLVENGERLVFQNVTIANSPRGINITGNGVSAFFTNCSIDFCTEFGRIANAWVFFTGCHLETGGSVAGPNYLFDVSGNSHVFMTNTHVLMSTSRPGGLYYMFKSDQGPTNYGFGLARFHNVSAFFTDQLGTQSTRFSEQMLQLPANATTVSFRTPFPYKWSPLSVSFAATDGQVPPNHDTVRVSGMSSGLITFEASAAHTSARWLRIQH